MRATVECTYDQGVATLTLCNQERRNAVSTELIEALDTRLSELEFDTATHAIVLTGAGNYFCVGGDLSASPEKRFLRGDSVAEDVARLRAGSRVIERLHTMPQVTIAAVNGACAGAGLSIALACDLRIATNDAVFNTAYLTAGLSGDFGGIWFATRLLGSTKARELFLLPQKISAESAYRIGMISSVHPGSEFSESVQKLADQIANRAPVALQEMKRNLLAAQSEPLSAYLEMEVHRVAASYHTDDAREAARAFVEKRRPVFSGR